MAKKLSFRPTGDRVLIKPAEKGGEKKLASGIILPQSAEKEKQMTGTVVAVGPGRRDDAGKRVPMDVAIGDEVVFKKPWDEPIQMNGEEFYVLSEAEIILIHA